jgi:hypothetical protein
MNYRALTLINWIDRFKKEGFNIFEVMINN